jgi:hypothetical protein
MAARQLKLMLALLLDAALSSMHANSPTAADFLRPGPVADFVAPKCRAVIDCKIRT